jgi:hypothetical protein
MIAVFYALIAVDGQSNLDQHHLIYKGFAPCKKAAFKVIVKGIFNMVAH